MNKTIFGKIMENVRTYREHNRIHGWLGKML